VQVSHMVRETRDRDRSREAVARRARLARADPGLRTARLRVGGRGGLAEADAVAGRMTDDGAGARFIISCVRLGMAHYYKSKAMGTGSARCSALVRQIRWAVGSRGGERPSGYTHRPALDHAQW
jgi:hypothetical protein